MKILAAASTAFLLTLATAPAMASTDCHQGMKQLLQGTLEIANEAETQPADHDTSSGCTLAALQAEPSMPRAAGQLN